MAGSPERARRGCPVEARTSALDGCGIWSETLLVAVCVAHHSRLRVSTSQLECSRTGVWRCMPVSTSADSPKARPEFQGLDLWFRLRVRKSEYFHCSMLLAGLVGPAFPWVFWRRVVLRNGVLREDRR